MKNQDGGNTSLGFETMFPASSTSVGILCAFHCGDASGILPIIWVSVKNIGTHVFSKDKAAMGGSMANPTA